MRVEITGRHFNVTDPIRNYINARLKKIPKILGDDADIHIILTVEKRRHIAEVILRSKLGKLSCAEETRDMYSSIGKALEIIEKQALKFKWKRITSKRSKNPLKALPIESQISGDKRPRIIIEKETSKKPISLDEALLALSQSRDSFIVFRDAESQLVKVLYKRKDGNYGLISPEE